MLTHTASCCVIWETEAAAEQQTDREITLILILAVKPDIIGTLPKIKQFHQQVYTHKKATLLVAYEEKQINEAT
ncbi:hypothetical protein MWX50_000920 [Morganella morganii]|nr:hypothetical protein [Morganella morganii]